MRVEINLIRYYYLYFENVFYVISPLLRKSKEYKNGK